MKIVGRRRGEGLGMKVTLGLIVVVVAVFLLESSNAGSCVVSSTTFDTNAYQIEWFGEGGKTLYVFTYSGNVYKSLDEGNSFVLESSKFPNFNTKVGLRNGVRLIVKTSDPKVIWFLGWGQFFWVTTDGGDTYTFGTMPYSSSNIGRLSVHPTKPQSALGSYRAPLLDF